LKSKLPVFRSGSVHAVSEGVIGMIVNDIERKTAIFKDLLEKF
jgi:hypothetical protein